MSGSTDFTKMVPGFDFLQGLMKNAGSGVPNFGQWIAPTLDPAELDKRIEELRTVQFWLEQNARMLAATIQALEVQRMTLTTLRTMNLPMEELRKSLEIRPPPAFEKPAPAPAVAAPAPPPRGTPRGAAAQADAPAAGPAGPVDPMQWWGALTQQFTELAANALKETTADAAKNFAGAMARPAAPAAGAAAKAAAPAKAPAKVPKPRRRPAG